MDYQYVYDKTKIYGDIYLKRQRFWHGLGQRHFEFRVGLWLSWLNTLFGFISLWKNTSAMIASSQILSNLLFINHPTIGVTGRQSEIMTTSKLNHEYTYKNKYIMC